MPALELTTNVKIADSKAFCLELSKVRKGQRNTVSHELNSTGRG